MKSSLSKLKIVILGIVACQLVGCYKYDAPSKTLLSNHFGNENKSATDAILLSLDNLTLEQAKNIAIMNNQNYQATFHYVNAAKMRYFQSLGAYSPEIQAYANVGQDLAWANSMVNPPMGLAGRNYAFGLTTTLSASWLIFDGFARYLNTLIAKSELSKNEAIKMRVLCMLKRSVIYAYCDIQLAEKVQEIQLANIEFQNRLAVLTKKAFDDKKRAEDEYLNFEVISEFSQANYLRTLNQQAVANYSLSMLMGYSDGVLPKKITVDPIPDEIKKIYYTPTDCINIALERNPTLKIMAEMTQIAKFNKYKSYSAFSPTFKAHFSYTNYQNSSKYQEYRYSHSSYSQNSMMYGISGNYLIFNGFTRYNKMREMQTLLAAAEFEQAETYLQVVNDILSSYATYETCYQQYEIFRTQLNKAKRQRDLVYQRYLNYDSNVDRVDRVQSAYIDSQILYATSITDFRKALAQLEAIMMIDLL